MPTASQVTAWIIRHRHDLGDTTTNLQLQKHLYYAQAFRLALTGEPLFDGAFEAWSHGPVLPPIYYEHRLHEREPIPVDEQGLSLPHIDPPAETHLQEVAALLAGETTYRLSRMACEEEPWREARATILPGANDTPRIPVERMRDYYADLIELGEARLSAQGLLDFESEPRWAVYYVSGICAKKLVRHPLHDWKLARALSRPVPEQQWPDALFSPAKKADRRSLTITDDVSPEEIGLEIDSMIAAE